MGYLLAVAGLLGAPICLVIAIVRAILKKSSKHMFIASAALLVSLVFGVIITPMPTPQQQAVYKTEATAGSVAPTVKPVTIVPTLAPTPTSTPIPMQRPGQTYTPPLTKAGIKNASTTASYKDLMRNPDDYIGQYVVVTVKIQQILESGLFDKNRYYFGYTDNSGYDFYFDDRYSFLDVRIDDSTKLLEDDILTVYGRFAGLETFQAAFTWTDEEMPSVEMLYVDILEE